MLLHINIITILPAFSPDCKADFAADGLRDVYKASSPDREGNCKRDAPGVQKNTKTACTVLMQAASQSVSLN
ncbi:MAG: hypothetical protein PUC00_12975 [Clostridiales bacterium]|nr:hypothetical protein [Clostridiales bacterium]